MILLRYVFNLIGIFVSCNEVCYSDLCFCSYVEIYNDKKLEICIFILY